MIESNETLAPADLAGPIARLWELSAAKLRSLAACDLSRGSPVLTRDGRYEPQGWTEWTLGFHAGSFLLQFDATGEAESLAVGRELTLSHLPPHLTHTGVHDHGFNHVSTFGNLRRLHREGRLGGDPWELRCYELALRVSGAVQAARWSRTADGGGFIHSFHGPHSLFADTMRTLRSLALARLLGQPLLAEGDERVDLLGRLVAHARATARYNVYYGEGRDAWDVPGRVAHESLFHPGTGTYRCPSTQQGWSPFTTWTRALAWVLLGFAEQLEFLAALPGPELDPWGGRADVEGFMLRAARAAADHYLAHTPADGIPYWDTGAPGLERLGEWRSRPADPFNDHEPVDSSAAAIAAQGLVRLGLLLAGRGEAAQGRRCLQAGLAVLRTLLAQPYLSTDPGHQGLILHSVYHRPRRWDREPPGSAVPRGEATLWGDYHAREAALLVQRLAAGGPYLTFWGPGPQAEGRR